MRQVPHYLILGSGCMAAHIKHYFTLCHIPYASWSRKENTLDTLQTQLLSATHVLVLISDQSIDTFIKTHILPIKNVALIHFSGALQSGYAISAHPLQTFSQTLYTLEQYQQIPFIMEQEAPSFPDLFPLLQNPHFYISKHEKPYYHALCVMANNFTTLLWQKFFNEMKGRYHIEKSCLMPYLKQTLTNLENDHENALTGPLKRKDIATLSANQKALTNDVYKKIYDAFVSITIGEPPLC